jgi:ABC-2 type transport system ATP-binding protein
LGRVHGEVDEAYKQDLVVRFELDVDKKVRAYSKGNRQKVLLIAALMCRPALLILDEPTSGLDPLMEREFRHTVAEAKGRGQTVFLSSHILSEVEALCDRVAILRNGRLVELGSLSEMRHLSSLLVEITFDGLPPDLSGVPGVRGAKADGNTLRLEVAGSIDPLLKELGRHRVKELLSREPSLEELFLSLYGDQATQSPGATVAG